MKRSGLRTSAIIRTQVVRGRESYIHDSRFRPGHESTTTMDHDLNFPGRWHALEDRRYPRLGLKDWMSWCMLAGLHTSALGNGCNRTPDVDISYLVSTLAVARGKMASMNGETDPFSDGNSYASIWATS